MARVHGVSLAVVGPVHGGSDRHAHGRAVGLSFAMPGDGRIGFAAVAVLWLAALAFLPSRAVLSPAASEARHR
jgi:hypothetical protein